jgi:hypothetical protein
MAHNPKANAVNITAPLNDGDDLSSADVRQFRIAT